MRVAVVTESRPGETRVALTPDLVARVEALGARVLVEAGAGVAAGYADEEYAAAGARLVDDPYEAADACSPCSRPTCSRSAGSGPDPR